MPPRAASYRMYALAARKLMITMTFIYNLILILWEKSARMRNLNIVNAIDNITILRE
ncbi:MAG: hypothetical protein V1874_12630 [Spirochaetota bacterium]